MKKSIFAVLSSALIVLVVLACARQVTAQDVSLNISWTQLDNYVRPGGETTMIISVQNTTTSTIYDIDLSFNPSSGITVTPSNFSINSISTMCYQSTSLKIVASENASSGTSYIEITAKYHVGSSSSEEKELKVWVPVVVRSVPLLKIEGLEYNPTTIGPGSDVTISFDIKNYGDGPAKDLVVSLDQTTGFFNADLSDKYVGDVPVNGSSSVSFNLTINQTLDVGSYSIPILLVYKDETRKEILSSREYAGIKVYGNINLITTLNSQDPVASGTSGQMEIKIANAGTMKVQFLRLIVLDSQFLEEVFPNNIYIGSLSSDDYDTERISFKVRDGVSKGIYPINFELVYQDIFGEQFTETKTVNLNVLSSGELGNRFEIPVWGMALIIVVAAMIAYYFLRKRRK